MILRCDFVKWIDTARYFNFSLFIQMKLIFLFWAGVFLKHARLNVNVLKCTSDGRGWSGGFWLRVSRKNTFGRQPGDGNRRRNAKDQEYAFEADIQRQHFRSGKGAQDRAHAANTVHPAGAGSPRFGRIVAGGKRIHTGIGAV